MRAVTTNVAVCRRRRRRLSPLAADITLARGGGRAFAPAAWMAGLAALYLLAQAPQVGAYLLPSAALLAGLCLIALFDAAYFVIPDGPIWVLSVIGLAMILIAEPAEAPARLAAAGLGYVSLRLVAGLYERWRGFPGVGQGDARLFAVAGLWLGFRGLPSALILAALSALISAILSMRGGKALSARDPIPFGPHLALGFWLVWTIGPLEFG